LSFGCHNDSSYDLYAYKGIHLKDAKDWKDAKGKIIFHWLN
jgi:hypothetical protein